MSGIAGFVNYKKDLTQEKEVLKKMTSVLISKENAKGSLYIDKNIAFGYKQFTFNNNYSIVYTGNIYNTKELEKTLLENDYELNENSDAEIILKSFLHYGKDVVKYLNGSFSFAIWNSKTEELFLARDHFGLKPLYYTLLNNTLVFASELKALFEYPGVEKAIDKQEISELIGLGPAHTPGITVYKDIFEIKPAHYAVFNHSGFYSEMYWQLESKSHTDDLDTTCIKLRNLIEDSINRQIVSDVPLCTFLSGGLDSSIITKFAGNYRKNNGLPPISTYSVDYKDNDKNFVESEFQPNSDNYYINLMTENSYSINQKVLLDTPELADSLKDALIAREMPGMADVDSSLLLFCKTVKKEHSIAVLGECADEMFAGYPWFFREDALNSKTFPWSLAISERQKLLNPNLSEEINLKDYVDYRYNESLKNVQILDTDSAETIEKKKISYLTINWFMQTLIERADKMSMYSEFEVRVPFCDYRIAEYMWNIPWEIKALNGREKGLLRYIVKDFLPEEIVNRKKSPYPKTHNPTYLAKIKNMLSKIIMDTNAPINYLLNRDYILKILETDGKAFVRPWFGQLMTGPQLMAYLCQVNMWLESFNIKLLV